MINDEKSSEFALFGDTGCLAVLAKNGVYREAPVFTREYLLYAKVSTGLVRLNANGTTSNGWYLDALYWGNDLHVDSLGRLCQHYREDSKAVDMLSLPFTMRTVGWEF